MPDSDFQLLANFYLPSEDSSAVDVDGVAELIQRRIPASTVDFARGRANVVANIDRLKSLGTPEIIYQGEYQLLDRTICVEIPVPNRSAKMLGFTSGFSYYDGCIAFQCTPFNVDDLKVGASFIAETLDLDVSLESADNLEIGILCKPGVVAPDRLVAERFADLATVSDTRDVTHDWSRRLESGCIAWMNDHPQSRTRERWLAVIADGHALAQSLHNRLTSLGHVRQASIVDFDREFWHSCLYLAYTDWSALVNLSGHPRPLLAGE